MKFDKVVAQPVADLTGIDVFRVENFPSSEVRPWLDRPDAGERIDELLLCGEITAQQAQWCRSWVSDGYLIIEGMFAHDELDRCWSAYEAAIATGQLSPPREYGEGVAGKPGRVLNPHFKLAQFERMLKAPQALDLVSLLLGATALPFQTIAGHVGSQQKAHSDSIHMTTYPQGFLVANWIAFEDIAEDSGPLEFYPGSHRLNYLMSRDCDISVDEGRDGYGAYHAKYETAVQDQIRVHDLLPHYFHARKGDVLFWHANLLHGGSPIRNLDRSRRALVCHYFAEGCVCYHDYTGTPSHLTVLPKRPMVERSQFDSAAYLRLNPDVAAAGVDAWTHYVHHGHAERRRIA
jgi:hypothetical protein